MTRSEEIHVAEPRRVLVTCSESFNAGSHRIFGIGTREEGMVVVVWRRR